MPKTKISEFSSTPANNTDIDGINIAEGCAPSGINDAIRELMSQLKDWQAGLSGDVTAIAAGGTGAATFAAAGLTTLTGTETLTNKTVEAGTFTNGYTEEVFSSTPTSTTSAKSEPKMLFARKSNALSVNVDLTDSCIILLFKSLYISSIKANFAACSTGPAKGFANRIYLVSASH